MATRTRQPIPKNRKPRRIKLYLREWREFMFGKKRGAPKVAEALNIERESYLKMERETWRASYSDAVIIARTIGVDPNQLQWPPPPVGQKPPESADAILEGASEEVRDMAIRALRGLVGKA